MSTPESALIATKNYNSDRGLLKMPEYGRNVQKMVEYCMTVQDREQRNKVAQSIIGVMGQLNPHLRDVEDYRHKLWTHLFVISDFQLDVDSPYPRPTPEEFMEKPIKPVYPRKNIRFGHYGKSIELLIQKAMEMEEGEEKKAFLFAVANLMKRSYLTWNRDTVSDDVIFKDMRLLSNGKINMEGVTLTSSNERQHFQHSGGHQGGGNKGRWNKNFKKNRNKKRY